VLSPPDVGLYLAELGKQYSCVLSLGLFILHHLYQLFGYLINLLHTLKFIGVTFSSEFTTVRLHKMLIIKKKILTNGVF
jgi:hypothetical protein